MIPHTWSLCGTVRVRRFVMRSMKIIKKTRQAAPNDLFPQKELIQEFADLVGIKQLATPAIEADDLMYSVAQELSLQSQRSILVTSDKDLGRPLANL